MFTRPKYPKQRNIFIVNDVPNKVEIENEEKWSSTSNLNFLTSLRTGKILNYTKSDEIYHYPIVSTDVYTSYLDMDYYGSESIEKNYDFNKEILSHKELMKLHDENDNIIYTSKEVPDLKFIKLDHFKDIYLSERLYNEFTSLLEEIRLVQPVIIVTTGKWVTMLLTGLGTLAQNKSKPGDNKPLGIINTYRTSLENLHESFNLNKTIVYPLIHPVNVHTMPDKHYLLEMDLQKLGYTYHKVLENGFPSIEDNRIYYINPKKEEILSYIDSIIDECNIKKTIVSIDIETLFYSIIDCIGITTKITEGICIPFSELGNPHFWSLEDETEILLKIYDLFTHENCIHLGQNYSYEVQNYLKSWGLNVPIGHDTLVLHHILYNYLPKDLGFLASIYSEDYRYWKNQRNETSEIRWRYNIKDICYTLEVLQNLLDIFESYSDKTKELYRFQLDCLSPILIERMYKGIKIDKNMKNELYTFFHKLMQDVRSSIDEDMGFEFNINSTPQKKKVFKDLLHIELEKKKQKNGPAKETCDAAAMIIYMEKYPLYKPLLLRMLEYGSLKVFTNTFLNMQLEPNDRACTSYKIAGTSTGRLSSSKNIWGRGANLQNLPNKGKINLVAAIEAIDEDDEFYADEYIEGSISLPNVKKMFLPDDGCEIADLDFDGADIRIVAAISECKWLLDFFENPKGKVYKYISSLFFQREITDDEYKTQKAVYHSSNYDVGLFKLASMLGIHIAEAKKLRDFYFHLCPEILAWHKRTQKQISNLGYIETIYGRRAYFVNKNDVTLLNKALAFEPQSTIGDSINRVIYNVVSSDAERNTEMLLQVHDSGVFQYPIPQAEYYRKHILDNSKLVLDYNGILMPLPTDIKCSQKSYGDCK